MVPRFFFYFQWVQPFYSLRITIDEIEKNLLRVKKICFISHNISHGFLNFFTRWDERVKVFIDFGVCLFFIFGK